MPIAVTLPDGTERLFPDGTATADIESQLGGALVPAQEPNPAVALRRSSGIPDAPGVGSDILGTVAEFAKGIPRGVVSGLAGTSRAGAEVSDFLTRNLGFPPSPIRALESATAQFLERKTREALPVEEGYEWAPAIGEGVGQVIPAMIGGGFIGSGVRGTTMGARLLAGKQAAKTAGAVASSMTFGPEFMDAFDRATEQGNDPDTAFAKSLGYATLASAIENRFGVGRLAGKLAQSWTPDLVKTLAKRGVAKEILKDAGINFAEEASQRAAQDLIVTGELDQEGIVKEGLVGAAVATLIGAPANIAGRPRPVSQAQKDAVWNEAFRAEPGPEKDALVEYAEAVSSLPSLRKPEPRLKVYEREAKRAGFDLANVVFDPTPRIIENERAMAELTTAQATLAAGPNPELEARLPELIRAASERTSVEASYDPSADRLTIHLPAIKDKAHLRDILREEKQHRVLATPEGGAALTEFLRTNPLKDAEVAELRAYAQRDGEEDGVYRARLSDEYLAKLNRGSWWKRWTGEAVAWLKSKFGWELTNEQAGRLVLRNLRGVAEQAPVAGAERESAVPIVAFRGTPKDNPGGRTGRTFWTPSETIAREYGPNVEKATLTFQRPLVAENWLDAKAKLGLPAATDMDGIFDAAERAGHDGVVWRHHGSAEYVQLRPAAPQLRESAVPLTDSDREYFAALESGDTAKAQAIVDEAARKAGYAVGPLFHGSDSLRNVFDGGVFLTDSEGDASEYAQLRAMKKAVDENEDLAEIVSEILAEEDAEDLTDLGPKTLRDIADANGIKLDSAEGYTYRVFVNPGKVEDFTGLGSETSSVKVSWEKLAERGYVEPWSSLEEDGQEEVRDQYRAKATYRLLEGEGAYAKAFDRGADTVAFFDQSLDGKGTHRSWLTKANTQIKSADPVTRDDAGNVIPPSQRFRSESPDIRFSLGPVEAYPTAPIVPVDAPGIRTENGIIQVGPDVAGDSPELKAAVAGAGIQSLPDPFLDETVLPILRAANPRLADSEARKTGLTGAALARHLLALELQDWRIREASGFLPWRLLYRLAQAFRLAITPRNERAALKAIRRIMEASAEQYRTGEPVSFNAEDQRQIFVDRNARMAGIVAPLVRSLRIRLSEERYAESAAFKMKQARMNELAKLASTIQTGENVDREYNPRSAKFLEEITDAGVTVSERDILLWGEYRRELAARGLARKMDALEAAEASLANIARIDPRLDVAALKKRVDRLTKSIAKADGPTTQRAHEIRADRKAALDRDAAARVLEDPQITEWAELLAAMEETGLQPRPVTGSAAADVTEAGNYFAMEFDEFAQRVAAELESFTEERLAPRMRALRDRLTALKKAEGETEVAMREVILAARGKADRSGSAMSREAMAALREIDAQIVRFAFGLAQVSPETPAGKLRDALVGGTSEDYVASDAKTVGEAVGLSPEVTNRILTLLRDDPEFRLVVEDMFDSSEKAVREHVLTTIELIEDVYAEGRAQLAMPGLSADEQKAIRTDIARKADELARRALARMRRDRNGVRREIRDAEREVFDLSAELLEKQTLAGLARDGLAQLGENRPHVRRMVYMAPGKGGEVLAEFGEQPEVRIPPDQAYTDTTIHAITKWVANARKAIEEQSEDAPTLRGLEIGIRKAASLVERMFTPDHLEKTLRPNALLDAFASSWLRTPAILSKLVPGVWSRLIDQRRADRDKAVRKANAIQQRTASKRRKLLVSAAESLGLDLFRRSGDPGILFDAYNEVAHQLRQHGSGVEVGQRFWLSALRARDGRITTELLNLIRFDRATGRELQSIEELRPYGGVRMRTGRGREIVRPSAPTGDIGLARLPKTQPLEDLVAAYDRAKAEFPNDPQRERDAQLGFWGDHMDAVASHIRDASRNDLLDERDPLLGPAEQSLTRAIVSGGREMPEEIGAWAVALAERLPKIGPWGNVETPMGAPNPDGIGARIEWATDALLNELSRYVPLARQRVAREQNGPARSSLEVAVRDDQNEFTMGAAQLAFPSAWYQYGASDSYRDMVNRITAPATVEYANSLDNAAKDLRTKAARIEDAKKQTDPGPALEEIAADIRWHTGSKGPITVDLAEKAADKMKRRAQAIEDYASKLRNPDFRTPPLPARLLSFSYGALLSTPTSWASNVFGGPITAFPVLSQFMAGPKAGLAMAGLLGASPVHGLLWEGSPFFPGLRKIGEWTGLLGPNETVAFLEGEGTGASWSRMDAADAEAWSAGQVTGKRARAAYERLKEGITGLSNVAGVGRGDVATNLLNARVTVPLALKALQSQARITEAARLAGVEVPVTDVLLKTREFLSAYGDPDAVLAEIGTMDARRWWKTELGATLGYDLLSQLNVASASNRPDTNWLVGLLGWTSQTLALFLGNSRLPANAGALRKGAKYLIAPTAMALASALSFWVQAGGRAWTKETFAKLSGELAVALSGVPDDDDEERFYWRALDWLSDNLARVLALLHVTWATAPVGALAGGIARSFQPAARPMPWEQGFWLRPGSQIVADIADSATGGIGFSVTDPSLPAISLLKNVVKSSTQLGRGILGLADGEETRAAAFADIKGGARGAANFLGAWGAALAEAVLPGGNAGRESRRLLQTAARDAGIVLRPGEAPDGWSAPLSLRKELLAAGVKYVEGDESAVETIRGLASFTWQRAYDRAIEQGNSEADAEQKAGAAVKAMLPSLDPVRNALGRSVKAEELAKLGSALASPAVQRDTKAARAVVDVLERRPPARMRSFRAAPSARSPLKAGRRSAGPKARARLRLSVPRI